MARALVVVNAEGDVVGPSGDVIAGVRTEDGQALADVCESTSHLPKVVTVVRLARYGLRPRERTSSGLPLYDLM